jgi:hypothetical protein
VNGSGYDEKITMRVSGEHLRTASTTSTPLALGPLNVEDDDEGLVGGDHGDAGEPVGGGGDDPEAVVEVEQHLQDVPDLFLVLDEHDVQRCLQAHHASSGSTYRCIGRAGRGL